MGNDNKNIKPTIPHFLASGTTFQFGVIVGYINNEPTLKENNRPNKDWITFFNFTTFKRGDIFTTLGCYIDNEHAYDFATKYSKLDQMVLFVETDHVYDPLGLTTNRTHVLSFTAFKDMAGQMPPLEKDEYQFLMRCLNVYRKGSPKPSDDDILKAKRVLNKWDKKGK